MPKPSKEKSREYLEAALDHARTLLPGWMFAVIHQAALPASGGRAASNRRRMNAAEKAWIEGSPISMRALTTPELNAMAKTVADAQEYYGRLGNGNHLADERAAAIAKELARRSGQPVIAKERPTLLVDRRFVQDGAKVEKGFFDGEPDGGMHAHGLDRHNSKTTHDGGHVHLFIMPGTGEVILTDEDGHHAHEIDDAGNATGKGGGHSHFVHLHDGTELETKFGGEHAHQLMVETSGFDGLHQHTLRLSDGTELKSITPGDFVERFIVDSYHAARPMLFSAREVTRALYDARHAQVFDDECEPAMPTSEEVLVLMSKGESRPELPLTFWEVTAVEKGIAFCALADMDEGMLMQNPHDLALVEGDIVDINAEGEIVRHSKSSEPHCFAEAESLAQYCEQISSATQSVDFGGPTDAVLVFVSASPSPLELARKEALIGPDGALFAERYLTPLGLKKSDVAAGFAIPVVCTEPTEADVAVWRPQLERTLKAYDGAKVVALGRIAKMALGPLMDFSLPHPAAVRRHGDRGEIDRKIRTISKALDISRDVVKSKRISQGEPSTDGKHGATLADSISELSKGESLRVAVTKSTASKQIVYGVILDPYQVDLHNDWIPPAEIETTAHEFLSKSRVVGLRHQSEADAVVVESWVEAYPSEKDRELALSNQPHRVWRRPFGNDTLHSGAWVAGVKLCDELWAQHQRGELDAFSIGGFSFKTQISTAVMPEVEFVDLEEAR